MKPNEDGVLPSRLREWFTTEHESRRTCKAGRHDDCTLENCECPERREQEEIERRLRAIRSADERLAATVLTTLVYSGSACARQLADQNDKATLCVFTAQIIATLKSMSY